ncbi:kinetochore protein NDC80 homolog [Apostichopus japonicus]|uniref:kinetochore protein NDC80 homolog n=1 Tax=Stichopus japonicus TaxID=307972 RepID=UPI003AB76101
MMRPSVSSRRSSAGGRQSSAGGRASLAPMRIKQDNVTNIGRGGRTSVGGRQSFGSANSAGSSRKRPVSRFRMGPPTTSRRSSASSIRGHEVLKDTRPLKDKSFMHQEIRDIMQFLQDYNCPHPITHKILMSPTTKDFLRVFEFIYSFLHPNYKMPAKHEEEIPQIYKNLRYPFTMSKTAMFSLGSPHTWPHILGALHWLTDTVKYALQVDINQLLFCTGGPPEDAENFQEVSDIEVFFNFLEKTYSEFLEGSDTYQDLEQELEETLKQKTLGMAGDLEQLCLEEKMLTMELQQLEQEPNQVVSACERLEMVKNDNNKFDKFLKDLDNHKRSQEQKYQDLELQVQQKELELGQLEQENCHLEHQLANQELSSVDVQRIQTEARMLNSAIDQVERENQMVDQEIWDEERKIAKSQEELEKKVAEYNSLARKLKLIPSDAENAKGIDFELRLTFGNQASMSDFMNTIKPALQQLKRDANEKIHEINNQRLLEEERLDQMTEIVENKETGVSKLEGNVQTLEKDITDFKEKSKREADSLTGKLAELEARLKMMIAQGDGDVQKAQENLENMRESNEYRLAEMAKEKKDYQQFLLKACTTVLEHKTLLQEHFQNLVQRGLEHLEKTQKTELPTSFNIQES